MTSSTRCCWCPVPRARPGRTRRLPAPRFAGPRLGKPACGNSRKACDGPMCIRRRRVAGPGGAGPVAGADAVGVLRPGGVGAGRMDRARRTRSAGLGDGLHPGQLRLCLHGGDRPRLRPGAVPQPGGNCAADGRRALSPPCRCPAATRPTRCAVCILAWAPASWSRRSCCSCSLRACTRCGGLCWGRGGVLCLCCVGMCASSLCVMTPLQKNPRSQHSNNKKPNKHKKGAPPRPRARVQPQPLHLCAHRRPHAADVRAAGLCRALLAVGVETLIDDDDEHCSVFFLCLGVCVYWVGAYVHARVWCGGVHV